MHASASLFRSNTKAMTTHGRKRFAGINVGEEGNECGSRDGHDPTILENRQIVPILCSTRQGMPVLHITRDPKVSMRLQMVHAHDSPCHIRDRAETDVTTLDRNTSERGKHLCILIPYFISHSTVTCLGRKTIGVICCTIPHRHM